MLDELDPTRPGARFPWAVTVFCAACVAAAAWTFMRFSYAWPVSLQELSADGMTPEGQWFQGRYVTFSGAPQPGRGGRFWVWRTKLRQDDPSEVTAAECIGPHRSRGEGFERRFQGRAGIRERYLNPLVHMPSYSIVIDCGAGRWTGASVAGLVVGAMGVFVFTLHLRRWLGVRRLRSA